MSKVILLNTIVVNYYTLDRLEEVLNYDKDLYNHCVMVASLSNLIGQELGLNSNDVYSLWVAGALHDYGKLFVDKKILNKAGRLSTFEFSIMKSHVYTGYRILSESKKVPEECLVAIKQHHEKPDGTGYPDGIKDVSKFGRILSIADVFSALIAERVYKKGMSNSEALMIIKKSFDFEEELIDALEKIILSSELLSFNSYNSTEGESC